MTFLARDESRPANSGPHHSVLSDSYKGARGLKAANAGLHSGWSPVVTFGSRTLS